MMFEDYIQKDPTSLYTRHGLSLAEVRKRLIKYCGSDFEIDDILISCKGCKSWSDGKIVVLYFKHDETYSIIASGINVDLIKP